MHFEHQEWWSCIFFWLSFLLHAISLTLSSASIVDRSSRNLTCSSERPPPILDIFLICFLSGVDLSLQLYSIPYWSICFLILSRFVLFQQNQSYYFPSLRKNLRYKKWMKTCEICNNVTVCALIIIVVDWKSVCSQ